MNYKNSKKHITALLAAMAVAGGTSVARAQFFPVDDARNFNTSSSFLSTVDQLNKLNIGTLPDGIKTVVANLNGYFASEQGKNGELVIIRNTKQDAVAEQEAKIDSQNTKISSQVGLINTLIASNPLDPQIAIEQANLDTMQSDLGAMKVELGTRNETLNTANGNVTDSDLKIALYKKAIDVQVANAQKDASDAADVITKARSQFASGGVQTSPDANKTGRTGLQGVIDTISGVTAGDQAPVVAAIQGADATFQATGAAKASIADIQALVGAINTNLPALPPISALDKEAGLQSVLNGSYERNAIYTIQSSGIAGIVHRDPVTGAVHIGKNSLITNEKGGVQELYAQNGAAAPININVTKDSDLLVNGVSVATDADVAAEKDARIAADNVLTTNLSNEVARATAAEGVLTTNLAKEVTDRAAADTVLDGKIAKEVTDRIADVNAEEAARIAAVTAEANTRAAADVTLQNNINAEAATRASADTTLQANIDAETSRATAAEGLLTTNLTKEVADRVAAVNTEKNRALAAESALANRATALEGRATALEGRVGRAEGRINSLRKGVSMAAALQTPVIEAGKQNAVKAGVATVDGAQGFGIAVARRINESVQVNLDVATDFETDTAARAGVNYSF